MVDDIVKQDIPNHTSNSAVEIREYVRDKYGVTIAPMDNPDGLRGPTLSAVWFDEVAAAAHCQGAEAW